MKLIIDPSVHQKLEAWVTMAQGMECSGYGWVRKDGDNLVVYDAILLDIRTSGYTEIQPKLVGHLIAQAMGRPDLNRMKLWWHRHPLGNSQPGIHNWSQLDDWTCRVMPFGMPAPESGFTASIVRTPRGWAGRIDTYGPKGKTVHVPVEVMPDSVAAEFDMIADLIAWQPPKRTYVDLEVVRDGDWPDLDAGDSDEDEWAPKRENYADDDAYLADLADYIGCDVDEFEIKEDGTVELYEEVVGRKEVVGNGVKPSKPAAQQLRFAAMPLASDKKDPKGIFAKWQEGVRNWRRGV